MMDGNEFMERHGEQVLTTLRHQVDFWKQAAKEYQGEASMFPVCVGQIESWQRIYDEAQSVVQ